MKKYIPIIIVSFTSILIAGWIHQKYNYLDLVFGPQALKLNNFHYQTGDDPGWADTHYDDGNWYGDTTISNNIWWLRREINLDTLEFKVANLEMMVFLQGAYQLFWNGHKIGKNGVVGQQKSAEIPGNFQSVFIIPDSLTHNSKKNVLALRVSNFYTSQKAMEPPLVIIGNYPDTSRTPVIFTGFIYIIGGIAFLMSLYFFSIYFSRFRDVSYLLFALFCFCVFYWVVIENLKFIYYYPYPLHEQLLFLVKLLIYFVSILLPVFFIYYFNFNHKRKIIILIGIPFLAVGLADFWGFDIIQGLWLTGIFSTLLLIFYASYLRINGYILSLVGIFPLVTYFIFGHLILLPGFISLIIALYYSDALKVREQRIQYERESLHSNRLQTEILKQQIQPHFLLNTLTSLIDWLEEEPDQAPKLIHALAEEYKMLMRYAEKMSITVREEIHLCRLHLTVMSYRKGVEYQLHTKNLDQSLLIPPAIFLTTIENGITHNQASHDLMEFFIEEKKEQDKIIFSIFNSDGNRKNGVVVKEGTGIKYIKARLEEISPNKWSFNAEAVDSGWKTIITFYNGKKKFTK